MSNHEFFIELKCKSCGANLEGESSSDNCAVNGSQGVFIKSTNITCSYCNSSFVCDFGEQVGVYYEKGDGTQVLGNVDVSNSSVGGSIVTRNISVGGDFVGGNKQTIIVSGDSNIVGVSQTMNQTSRRIRKG